MDLFQHGHSVASQRDTLLAGLPSPPQLGTDLGRRMPATWPARLPPAGWPLQSAELRDIFLMGITGHHFICSLRAQQGPLHHASLEILRPIFLEHSLRNLSFSEAFLRLLTSEPAARWPYLSFVYAFLPPWNHSSLPICDCSWHPVRAGPGDW